MKQYIRGIFLALLLLVLWIPNTALAANIVSSGTCGDNLTWVIYDQGADGRKLVIQGTGPMNDYKSSNDLPWVHWRNSITTIEVKNGVTSIGRNAFYNFDKLTSISLPDSLIAIGRYAISYCNILETITLPEGLTTLGDTALGYCYLLKSISIPASVKTLDATVFTNCTALTAIHVDPDNPYYSSIDGVLFNKDQTSLLSYPNGKSNTYTIPAHVTSISTKAFANCLSLESVTLSEGLSNIDDHAFASCKSLPGITFPSSIIHIGEYAFDGCEILSNVIFLGSPNIEDYAFSYCYKLSKIIFLGEAPEIAENSFKFVTAQVSYPADDPSWTADVCKNYGGGFNWAAFSCSEDEHPFLEVIPAKDPTCDQEGAMAGFYCGACGEVVVTQEVIPATGHAYGDPTLHWADDLSSAYVALTCHCENVTTEECQLQWDDSKKGMLTVTATYVAGEDVLTQSQKIIAFTMADYLMVFLPQDIPALTLWVADYSTDGQMVFCSMAEYASDGSFALQLPSPPNNGKVFFVNGDSVPLFPVLRF